MSVYNIGGLCTMEDGGMLVIKPENYDKSLVSKRILIRSNEGASKQEERSLCFFKDYRTILSTAVRPVLVLSLPELLDLCGQMVATEPGDTSVMLSHCCCFLLTVCPLSLLLQACHPH